MHKQYLLTNSSNKHHFLIDSISKLRIGSSRVQILPPAVRLNEDCLESYPDCNLCVVDKRPLLETSRLERHSLNSPDEPGLVLAITAFLEVLPYREELRPFSESGFWQSKRRGSLWVLKQQLNSLRYDFRKLIITKDKERERGYWAEHSRLKWKQLRNDKNKCFPGTFLAERIWFLLRSSNS